MLGNNLAPPRIQLNPAYIQAEENSPAQAECKASSASPVVYEWTRLNGDISREAYVSDGLLLFNAIRSSDAGEYRCHARNQFGDDTKILYVYVQPRPQPQPNPQPPPHPGNEVSIQPPSFNGRPGDDVVLTCHNLVNVYATLVWSKSGHPQLPAHIYVDNGVLTIQRATVEDSGQYICTSTYQQAPPLVEVADVFITSGDRREPPQVKRFNDIYNIVQGDDFSLPCEATGNPQPIVKWTKVHEDFESNIQQIGNILRITNAQPGNRGVYTCIAEADGVTVEESTVIDVERKCSF